MQLYDTLTILAMCAFYIWYTIKAKAKERDKYENAVVTLLAIIVVLLTRILNG